MDPVARRCWASLTTSSAASVNGCWLVLAILQWAAWWDFKASRTSPLKVCMYVFTDREGTKWPKKTILGRR